MPTANENPRNLQEEIGKTAAFDFPEQEAYLNLVRTHAVLVGEFAQLFKEFGLSDAKYNALRIIGAAGARGVFSETVGAQMVARDPDTTRLIDRLVKAGLVARTRSEEDRRCVVVSITPDGLSLIHISSPRDKRQSRMPSSA